MKKLLTTIGLVSAIFAQDGKLAVSILDFTGEDVQDKVLRACYQQLETSLIESNRFVVIEKGQRDELLKEQKIQSSGICDEACAVEIGQLLGAEYLMLGEIIGFADLYQVNIKIINIEKGDVTEKVTNQIKGGMSELLTGMEDASREIVRRIATGGQVQQPGLQQTGMPTTQVKTYGNLDVTTNPSGANILLDGIDKGVTPKIIEKIETGPHNLVLVYPRYETLQKRIIVEEGKTIPISELLVPKTGSLSILSDPIGASVYLDGMPKGKTPLDLSELLVKDYMVRVELQDYEIKENRITVQYRQNTTQKYDLKPLPGKVTLITDPTEMNVKFGGRLYKSNATGLLLIELDPVGKHKLDFSKFGYEPLSKRIGVGANENKTLEISLNKLPAGVSSNPNMGFLTLKTNALKAQARISGESGPVPVPFEYYGLPFGNYSLKVSARGYESKKTQATISKQKTTTLEIDLNPKSPQKVLRYSAMFPGAGQIYGENKTRGILYSLATIGAAVLLNNAMATHGTEKDLMDQYYDEYSAASDPAEIDRTWTLYSDQTDKKNSAQFQMIAFGTTLVGTWVASVVDAWLYHGLDQ